MTNFAEETKRRWQRRRRLWDKAFASIDLAGRTVLDAGTGEGYMARYLAARGPEQLVSVTKLAEEIAEVRASLTPAEASAIILKQADLTCLADIPDATFDIVVGDFLIAAVYALSPFREVDVVRELIRVLRPGGRLVLTGWQYTGQPRRRVEWRIRQLFALREAIHVLGGTVGFREHPAFWAAERMREANVPPEQIVTEPDLHRDFSFIALHMRNLLEVLPNNPLTQGLHWQLATLEAELDQHQAELAQGVLFGELYAVIGCKIAGGIVLAG